MKDDKKDVGFIDDAILYIQNAIACENHAIESYVTTKDERFLDITKRIRRKRSELMYKIIPKTKAEIYIWAGSNFGGCDLPFYLDKYNFDLLINFGHARFKR